MDKDSKFTRDEDGYIAVRTVSAPYSSGTDDKDSMFTTDEDGYVAVRTINGAGSGGGDSHNKGYFATQTALEEAYPTAEAGDWAIVGATDTVWIWDEDNSAWVDSDQKGQVVSVNGKTGTVNLTATDVDAMPQYSSMPTANATHAGEVAQFIGTTSGSYTHNYIYECAADSTYYEANIAFEQGTFASEDFEKAGKLIVDAGVVAPTEVTGGTMTYALAGNLWSIIFTDENGNALNTAYSIYTDDLEQDYDILPVVDPSEFTDGQVVSMTINNVSEEQSYEWERINVQPESGGSAVDSVNGKTGDVVLTAEDVGALPDSTVIPAAQIQSDWTQADSSAVDYIKNKPTIPAAQVNADWSASSGVAEILNKPTIPDPIQYSSMPTASAINEGDIVQFTGTTDATYTNGYFYKCVSDGQNPATYSWVQTNVQPMGATINDNATTSLTETWSANKLNTMIGDVETLLSQI